MLSVRALNSDEWTWSASWSSQTYYQGDNGTVTITFSSSESVTVSSVSIQFDWQTAPTYERLTSPVYAPYTFPALSFSIPADAVVGSHNYTISFQGQEYEVINWASFSVTSAGQLNVSDANEKVYAQTIPTVQNSLSTAQSYQSPKAQSLLQQATSMYNQATTYANQGQRQNAVNDLNSASSYLSQAAAAEQTYLASLTPTPTINNNNNNATPTPSPEFSSFAVAVFLTLLIAVSFMITVKKRKMGKS